MKKQFLTLVITLVVLSLMLVVNSCKKDGTVDPTNGPMLMNSQIVPDNVMPAFDAEEVTVYGDIDSDLRCYPDFTESGSVTCNRSCMTNGVNQQLSMVNDRMGPGFKVIDVIKRMKLNDRQLAAIRGFMVDYHACVKDVMTRTEAQRQKAIERAKAAREDVIARYKAGEIERARAAAAIAEINKALRASLETLINKDALCDCLKTLYRQIRSTLTEEQAIIWDKWVANQKLPCLTSVRTTP
jgi:hypothetical protein